MWRQLSEIFESFSGWRRLLVVFCVLFVLAFVSARCLQPGIDWYGGLEDCTVVIFVSRINWNEQKFDRIYHGLSQHTHADIIVSSTVDRLPALESRYDRRVPFRPLKDISVEDVDAVILVGGTGVRYHFGDAELQELVRDMAGAGRALASVGTGAALLSDAGVAVDAELVTPRDVREKVKEDGAVAVDERIHIHDIFITASVGSERDFLREFVPFVQELQEEASW